MGGDGSEVQVGEAKLGAILRTQHSHCSVLLCLAEARGMPTTWQNQAGHHPFPQIQSTSTHSFPGLKLLPGFTGSCHGLVTMRLGDELGKLVPSSLFYT